MILLKVNSINPVGTALLLSVILLTVVVFYIRNSDKTENKKEFIQNIRMTSNISAKNGLRCSLYKNEGVNKSYIIIELKSEVGKQSLTISKDTFIELSRSLSREQIYSDISLCCNNPFGIIAIECCLKHMLIRNGATPTINILEDKLKRSKEDLKIVPIRSELSQLNSIHLLENRMNQMLVEYCDENNI